MAMSLRVCLSLELIRHRCFVSTCNNNVGVLKDIGNKWHQVAMLSIVKRKGAT